MGKKIQEIVLPPGLLIVIILWNNEKVIPTGKTELLPDDILILSAAGFYDDHTFILSEIVIPPQHEWCGKTLSEISMPKDNLIIMIKRGEETVIPNGRIEITANDVWVMTSGI